MSSHGNPWNLNNFAGVSQRILRTGPWNLAKFAVGNYLSVWSRMVFTVNTELLLIRLWKCFHKNKPWSLKKLWNFVELKEWNHVWRIIFLPCWQLGNLECTMDGTRLAIIVNHMCCESKYGLRCCHYDKHIWPFKMAYCFWNISPTVMLWPTNIKILPVVKNLG